MLCELGLYRTSSPVRKPCKFSKSRLSRNRFPSPMLEEKYIEFIFFHFFLIINMFENISPDSVRSGRTCPANLGVWSCLVRILIWPVRLSPIALKSLKKHDELGAYIWLRAAIYLANCLVKKSRLWVNSRSSKVCGYGIQIACPSAFYLFKKFG